MRVQKYPSATSYASTWPDLAGVPAGVTTEEMSGAEFATWLAAQPLIDTASGPAEVELWRVRALCARRGKDAAVATGIATLTAAQQQVANAQWTYSKSLLRDDWFTKNLRLWMGYTNPQMDSFFQAAADL